MTVSIAEQFFDDKYIAACELKYELFINSASTAILCDDHRYYHNIAVMGSNGLTQPGDKTARFRAYVCWKEIERRAMKDYCVWRVHVATFEQYCSQLPMMGMMG